ncbi:MAG: 2-hydroxyacyl-CoA dehydratase, partial [Deltaproteobacteria bacterium]|nr:2-hydroxyacyl-CoA dehydratase [Deltaproteobacteria bacterium]MBW2535597.1 2-hydroxyacyl-CoA dehydratase [Deltaproteobacteria bacterium]
MTDLHRARAVGYGAANLAKLGGLGLRVGVRRGLAGLRRYPWLLTLLGVGELHFTMTRDRHGPYHEANAFVIHALLSGIADMVEGIVRRPHETVVHEDLVPPEILFGMGLHPWMAELLGIVLPMVDPSSVEPYIDVAENAGIPPDVCSLPKSTVGLALAGHMPKPAAIVTSNMPCDGGMAQYSVIERALGVPTYRLDVPHDFHDERAVDYFAAQLGRLVRWLEAHTPGRMDWDRLRRVCELRNQAMEWELELWDTLRARPAPMAAEPIYLSHMMWGVARPGTERGVQVFRRIAELAKLNLERGRGALSNERYRVALWNPPTLICLDLFAWAEQAYGVALLMDMLTYHRHPYVDTRSPETMLRDLARIIMQGPMARHTRGPAVNFFGDLFHTVEHFGLDMIWMAGHVGCKNTQALSGMFREECRRRSIPLLIIDYDLSDTRVVPPDGIRRQVERFMETVMRADRLVEHPSVGRDEPGYEHSRVLRRRRH